MSVRSSRSWNEAVPGGKYWSVNQENTKLQQAVAVLMWGPNKSCYISCLYIISNKVWKLNPDTLPLYLISAT